MRQRQVLTHADAMKIVSAVQTELERGNKGAAVAVVDSHGELIAFLRTDGCLLPSINNAINKAFTAARQREPTADIGQSSRDNAWPLTNFGDLRYIGWGGGVPIEYGGWTVGGVGVSGLTEEEDMALAQLGLQALAD